MAAAARSAALIDEEGERVVVVAPEAALPSLPPFVSFTRSVGTAAFPEEVAGEEGAGEVEGVRAFAAPLSFSAAPVAQVVGGCRAGGVEAVEGVGDTLRPSGRRALRVMAALLRSIPADTARADNDDGAPLAPATGGSVVRARRLAVV